MLFFLLGCLRHLYKYAFLSLCYSLQSLHKYFQNQIFYESEEEKNISEKIISEIENDKDRIKTDDIMKPLYDELVFWQKQLSIAEIAEGTKITQVRFTRYDMGY